MTTTRPDSPAPGGPATGANSPPVRRRRRWPWLLLLCLLIVAGLIFLPGIRKRPAEAPRSKAGAGAAPVTVATAVAHQGDIGVFVNALGAVTPLNTVMVRSRVDGQLMSVNYLEGQMVRAGDSLAEIDPRPFQAQLVQAEGQLTRDQALLENARVDLERYRIALSSNAIPRQQWDTQRATVQQYEGTVKFDQGQVDTARLQLVYAHITAPISGRVGLRLVDAGNMVHATDTNPLAVLTQLQPITVLFSVAEDYLPQIQRQLGAGQALAVEAYDRSQQHKLATGTLLALDNQIDPTTGTVRLKGLFTNDDQALFPNQFVNVRLLVDTQHNATLVPTTAIQRNAQGPFVYLVQTNQTIALRPVSLGPSDGEVTAVQGLEPGQVVAADNFNRLQEGVKIVPRRLAQAGAPSESRIAATGAAGP